MNRKEIEAQNHGVSQLDFRILLICHCEKESGNLIRIISARKATTKERQLYKGEA